MLFIFQHSTVFPTFNGTCGSLFGFHFPDVSEEGDDHHHGDNDDDGSDDDAKTALAPSFPSLMLPFAVSSASISLI